MQGVTLLVSGYVFLASLAAPAVLLADEEPQPSPSGEEAAAAPADETQPAQPPANEVQPAQPQGDGVEPEAGKEEAAKDEAVSPAPAPAAGDSQADTPADQGGKSSRSDGSEGRRDEKHRAKAAAVRTVTMRNIEFNPRNITIDPGDTVRWENADVEKHNALGKNGSFETPVIGKGESSEHTFKRAGDFPYFCSLHQGMTGTVTVAGSGSGGSGSGGGGAGGTSPGSGRTSTGSLGGTSAGSLGGTTGSGSGSTSGSGSSLPATGQDLIWLALAGGALLTFGAALSLLLARRA
jgi:LPXTG-motif cell wall-anchored protein